MVTQVNIGVPTVPHVTVGDKEIIVVLDGAGAAAAASALTKAASVALSGHRAVIVNSSDQFAYPSQSNAGDGQLIAGITTGATAQGAAASIVTAGEVEEPTWSWTPGPIFVGDNGVLTQTVPSGLWLRQIGVAITTTKVLINLNPVIQF